MFRHAPSALIVLTLTSQITYSQTQPEEPIERFRLISEAVILDVVVRDSKGRFVKDLSIDEFHVFENGKEQQIQSLRFVDGTQVRPDTSSRPDVGPEQDSRYLTSAPVSVLNQFHLVSLVFDRLENESRKYAREAIRDLFDEDLPPDTYFSVFVIDQALRAVSNYTTDRAEIQQAVELATSGSFQKIHDQSRQIHAQLVESAERFAAIRDSAPDFGSGTAPMGPVDTSGFGAAMKERIELLLLMNILERSFSLEGEFQAHAVLDGLSAVVSVQRDLPGRKTVLYFSEGVYVPEKLTYRFRNVISESNLSNVSIYGVDARGLTTVSQNRAGAETLSRAAQMSQLQVQSVGGISASQMRSLETAENSVRMNVQQTLEDLSRSTGGFLTANTNDTGSAMERLADELNQYYEIAYIPETAYDDSKYRKISVKVDREALTVQSRDGYFPIPVSVGGPVMGYELPMLAALNSGSMPRDLPLRSRTFQFTRTPDSIEGVVAISVPFQALEFQIDTVSQEYNAHFSLLALIKELDGKVIHKLSREYPLNGPVSELEQFREGDVLFMRQFKVPPGHYHAELAAYDFLSRKAATKRQSLVAQAHAAGVSMSDLILVQSLESLDQFERLLQSPLNFGEHRVVPHFGKSVKLDSTTELGFYCSVYPVKGVAADTTFTIAVFKGNEPLFKGSPQLHTSRDPDTLTALFAVPSADLSPGTYRLKAWAEQGESVAVKSILFTLE